MTGNHRKSWSPWSVPYIDIWLSLLQNLFHGSGCVCSLKVGIKILVAKPQWGKASRIILSNPEEEEYSHPMSLDKSDPYSRSQSLRSTPILPLQRPSLIYVFPADLQWLQLCFLSESRRYLSYHPWFSGLSGFDQTPTISAILPSGKHLDSFSLSQRIWVRSPYLCPFVLYVQQQVPETNLLRSFKHSSLM